MKSVFYFLVLPLFFSVTFTACTQTQNEQTNSSAQQVKNIDYSGLSEATFAGGCFWCTEAVFEQLKGVKDVVSGYSGGEEKNPTYKAVSAGKTSHAESIAIYYNPEEISYQELLAVFFATHDPTQLNRQGPDVGPQYRSAIFYHNEEQKNLAKDYIQQLEKSEKFDDPIVTLIEPFDEFYEAEAYHQDFYRNNPDNPYVMSVAKPKVEKFEKQFEDRIKPSFLN